MTIFTAVGEFIITVLWYIFFGCLFAIVATLALVALIELIDLIIFHKED